MIKNTKNVFSIELFCLVVIVKVTRSGYFLNLTLIDFPPREENPLNKSLGFRMPKAVMVCDNRFI